MISPEEKKCTCPKDKMLLTHWHDCPMTEEPDFITKTISEFRSKWDSHHFHDHLRPRAEIETFLTEKLTEALHQKSMSDVAMAFEMGQKAREAEIMKIVEENSKGSFTDDAGNDCWYIDDLLAAIKTPTND